MPSFSTLYATVLARLKVIEPTATWNVTRYAFTLGARDATTGWPAATYAVGATIEMMMFTKASQQNLVGCGIWVRTDALGLTLTACTEHDEIKDANGNYYRVLAVRLHPVGDLTVTYEVDLVYLGDNHH